MTITRRTALAGLGALGAGALAPGLARAQAPTILRYANAGAPTSISNQFNEKLSAALKAKTDDALSLEIFAGSLGGEQKLLNSLALGSVDIYNGAYTGTREFDALYSPYFFKDGQQAKRVMEGEIGQKASAVLEDRYNGRLLGVGRLGSFNLMLKEPISSLSDIKGRKIRSAQIEGCLEGLSFFGAVPTPIPFNEIYLALQQGIVDGVLTALNPGVTSKFYEVCKYVVSADFGLALDKEVISSAAWGGLPEEEQNILQSTFDELEGPEYYEVGLAQKSKDLDAWAGANGPDSVIDLPTDGLAEELAPLNKRLADEIYGPGAWDMIQAA
ncbi:TRAP transporter substrate-binding protein [Acuticoccus mangrovi]|uniref:TRAP transporter substrate-binding protein n=1 Tax=Acuticoccus mangrovi TaxID=2796142 RepID=A0A934IPP2_9HYPH|nr:TRAP transporter substrate-binding protein [Acuticoccus mangrovi]MBJ3776303.1 TRAP transporter substrate-binding protein [Acuticoccus mangrovi]